jgi:hypothetical protein
MQKRDALITRALKFTERGHERKFTTSKNPFQVLCFKILCLTLITLASAIFISNPLTINLFQINYMIPFIFSMGLVVLVYLFITRSFKNQVDKAIIFMVISFIIGSCEVAGLLLKEEDWTPNIFLLLGVNLQTGCLFVIISRIHWIYNIIAICITQSYIWLRVLHNSKGSNTILPAYITLAVYLILLPILSYAGEREDRKVFLEVQLYEENLEAFKNLIKHVIPSSIVLIEGQNILFFNEKIKEMFDVEEKAALVDTLGKIQVIFIKQGNQQILVKYI